ncbi:asparagine synthase (glutamine-hydrolyzing) [Luteitalea sp.]|uniref:asparagine synthase (glutamine-hydrolyzing) n=1 Tax=Luteitalea sp. TaxID=2004800 RepID=UPI0037CB7173
MCGITGFWDTASATRDQVERRIAAMTTAIAHRGPDDDGAWWDGAGGPVLGFRRLAILDLSPAGHQPMASRSGRFTIAFNGEIYNYRDLKAELVAQGWIFRGGSDTEVILAAAEHWGVEGLWARLWGMFAIALWDAETRQLHLVRDRLGKKPLYFGRLGGVLLFGSELKALRAHPAWDAPIDRSALAAYFRYAYVPGDRTIHTGVSKVPAGGSVTFDSPAGPPETRTYWSALEVAREGVAARPARAEPRQAMDELEALLGDAVARRMIADVPLGAFLSGGIDSSLVTALMTRHASGRVRTFTIGFDEEGYDEAAAARAVADVLGTDHTEFRVTAEQARDVIPRLPRLYDEPFADSSQIPTFLVSELARQHVTVALSGDGGDEIFGGYLRYQFLPSTLARAAVVPGPFRRAAAAGMQACSPATWDRAFAAAASLLPRSARQARPGEKLHKLANVLAAASADEAYLRTVSTWPAPGHLVIDGSDPGATWDTAAVAASFPDTLDRLMALDTITYLPDDILVKVDRATMGVSLESRAPLLDHRVLAWAWRQPQSLKIADGRGKWLLREILARHVPRAVFERPKMGFAIPVGEWLRGPLRPWAEALLDPVRLRDEGYLRPEAVSAVWKAHLGGRGAHEAQLWSVLMFEAWLEAWR